jgi:hypothetical protein
VFVVTTTAGHPDVTEGVVDLMARFAHLRNWENIPVREIEPISLNAALQASAVLRRQGVWSFGLVTPGFRSRRSSLVYDAVLRRDGVATCVYRYSSRTASRRGHGRGTASRRSDCSCSSSSTIVSMFSQNERGANRPRIRPVRSRLRAQREIL